MSVWLPVISVFTAGVLFVARSIVKMDEDAPLWFGAGVGCLASSVLVGGFLFAGAHA